MTDFNERLRYDGRFFRLPYVSETKRSPLGHKYVVFTFVHRHPVIK